jgi:TrmH family RNA methyltransferase
MISKNLIKNLRRLEQKKHRQSSGLFVGEGPKVVGELLSAFQSETFYCTSEWAANHRDVDGETVVVSDEELQRLSFLQHPQQVLGVFHLPVEEESLEHSISQVTSSLCLGLDGVRDPGNVGTIIRIADWFGIDTVFCSTDSADAFSPKVVQATMGSLARVRVIPTDLFALVNHLPPCTPVYGTLLDGDNLYTSELFNHGLLLMGNESLGLSPSLRKCLTHRLFIPPHPPGRATAESLNVAVATAICCAEFRRRIL